jgi:N-acetyl-gamma-glutamyl-phosphate reductase
MVRAAVIGAAGYTGVELVRLLLAHPDLQVTAVTSTADAGRPLDDLYPALAGCGLTLQAPVVAEIAQVADVAFLAVPHTAALPLVPPLLDAGLTVVDLSADFRLQDAATYEAWYETTHTSPELLASAVYGLPEMSRVGLAGANLIACPGCYPTASILAAIPALESGVSAAGKVVVDAISGVSGAGRSANATTHYCSANESLATYKVATHRHTPEIAQALTLAAGRDVSVVFTPHLAPLTRGLLATVYLDVTDGFTTLDAVELYAARYSGEAFVTVHPAGRMPSTAEVRGSNRAHIGVAVDRASGTLIATCAIDNLVKGSGGQAIQCANIALGLPETDGLTAPAPVV